MALANSKKGFTLVELVVVIAVLAIIAAIAIPSVIGIIGSASQSAEETQALDIGAACKEYYAGIISGSINASNKGGSTQTGLPVANAGVINKTTAARAATVKNALEYNGTYNTMQNLIGSGDNVFVYDSEGNVHSAANPEFAHLTSYLTESTTLGTLYP